MSAIGFEAKGSTEVVVASRGLLYDDVPEQRCQEEGKGHGAWSDKGQFEQPYDSQEAKVDS